MSAVRTAGLTKRYGTVAALEGVDLDVPEGALFGLVGPNGSGKTTLLETLAGLRRPSAGTVTLPGPAGVVAYCPDVAEMEPWLTAIEVLDAAVGLLGASRCRGDLQAALKRVGLADVAGRRVGGFSRGMTTRLNIAAALIGDPAVILIDEPAAALDPAGRAEILGLVASLAPATTVVVSSHDLADVEAVCDHVGILTGGRLLYQGPIAQLLANAATPSWQLVVRPPTEPTLTALGGSCWAASVEQTRPGEIEFTSPDPEAVEANLAGLLAGCAARVVSLSPMRPSFEQIFLALTAKAATSQQQDAR
ncbi:MAG TPA: ABC transporter ATP-binding protein [Streptosporangiaceae bacterium]|jgi:ABC-2 type transport system ATP-binding protein|nr:ABC transporter ATP-binding protein [Streptosporangiaceae bacterium]